MKPSDVLKQQFLEVVKNQLKANDPPATAATLQRLQEEGYTEEEGKLLIASCVAAEMMQVMQSNQPFDEKRYIHYLNNLPEAPQ
jgi:hypothetical protein